MREEEKICRYEKTNMAQKEEKHDESTANKENVEREDERCQEKKKKRRRKTTPLV